jgi:hypothetical protein
VEWAETLAVLVPLVLICFPIIGLIAILAFLIALRYVRMKETAMLMDRGMSIETSAQHRADYSSRLTLLLGVIVSMIGLALSVALYPIGFVAGSPYPLALGPWMIPGLVPFFVGLAPILWHFLSNRDRFGRRR